MNIRRASCAASLIVLLCAAAPPVQAQPGGARAARATGDLVEGMSRQRLARIGPAMQEQVAGNIFPGAITIVARHGKVVHFEAHGYQDAARTIPLRKDALFRLASMTKPIVTVAAMMLVEQGRMKLGDPITNWLPELKDLKVETPSGDVALARPIWVQDLMRHTAGFVYAGSTKSARIKEGYEKGNIESREFDISGDEMLRNLGQIPLAHQPGTFWEYSVAVDVLGLLIERAAGKPLDALLREMLFEPLGMTDTAFYVTPDRKPRFAETYRWDKARNALVVNEPRPGPGGYEDPGRLESGGGGLVASTHDYARFAQMLLNRGELGGVRVLKPETVDLMARNHIGNLTVGLDGTSARAGADNVRFGLDFAIHTAPERAGVPFGKGTYYWGGLAGTWFWIDPVNDLAFVGMIQNLGGNRPGAMDFRAESARLVYAALAARPTTTASR